MMKKLLGAMVTMGVALAVLVANSSVWPTSALIWHQPEVPASLRK
ncbi:MAG: cyclic lactone autoinducer peptide [Moorella sp. (in: Bacteria)]|nr:cyclic lactone autoinducer peptide [Moorella sp. (in: firmicutes)]